MIAAEPPPRRDLIEDTMANWALEGMEPNASTLEDLQAVADGRMTLEEFHAKTHTMVDTDEKPGTATP